MSMARLKKDRGALVTGGTRRITLAAIESLSVPLVQEVVFLADFRCARCQKRVAEIMAKMNGETQSVMMSVLEKKVTLTCTYPNADRYQGLWRKASAMLRRLCSSCFRTTCSSCTRTTD